MTKQVAIGGTAAVCGLCLAFFGLGRLTGFNAGVKHERRFGVSAITGGSVAVEVQAAGGVIVTGRTTDGWASVLTVDGKPYVGTGATPQEAERDALVKWKGL